MQPLSNLTLLLVAAATCLVYAAHKDITTRGNIPGRDALKRTPRRVPGPDGSTIAILSQNSQHLGDGSYSYSYETENGIQVQESGSVPGPDSGTQAQGGYSYTSPEGQLIQISYSANENGFLPQGAHLPTPPPIPEAILRALEQNAADEAAGIFDDGSYKGEGAVPGRPLGPPSPLGPPRPPGPPMLPAPPRPMPGYPGGAGICPGAAASFCG